MSDGAPILGDGPSGEEGELPFVPPDGFIAPSNTPLHVECHPAPTDRGEGRVMMRIETIHGSFVCFMLPDVAAAVAEEMADSAARAKLIVFGEGPNDIIVPPRNRKERRHGRTD